MAQKRCWDFSRSEREGLEDSVIVKKLKVGQRVKYSFHNSKGTHLHGVGKVYEVLCDGYTVRTPRTYKFLFFNEVHPA